MALPMVEAAMALGDVRLSGVMPSIAKELDGMERALITRVFKSIEDGSFTPGQAQWAWYELLSYRRLGKRLTARAKLGQSAMESLGDGAKMEVSDA